MNRTEAAGVKAENAATNRTFSAAPEARGDRSIVKRLSRLYVSALNEEKPPARIKLRLWNGVYLSKETVRTAPDGYVRRSPVQPTLVAKDYASRIAVRVAVGVMLAAIALAGLYLLFDVFKII